LQLGLEFFLTCRAASDAAVSLGDANSPGLSARYWAIDQAIRDCA